MKHGSWAEKRDASYLGLTVTVAMVCVLLPKAAPLPISGHGMEDWEEKVRSAYSTSFPAPPTAGHPDQWGGCQKACGSSPRWSVVRFGAGWRATSVEAVGSSISGEGKQRWGWGCRGLSSSTAAAHTISVCTSRMVSTKSSTEC